MARARQPSDAPSSWGSQPPHRSLSDRRENPASSPMRIVCIRKRPSHRGARACPKRLTKAIGHKPAPFQALGEQASPLAVNPDHLDQFAKRRHSAYDPVLATIEYRWHPLFGRRLRLREGARRGRFDIVLVEDQPGRLRDPAALDVRSGGLCRDGSGPPARRDQCAVESGGRPRRDVGAPENLVILRMSCIPGGRWANRHLKPLLPGLSRARSRPAAVAKAREMAFPTGSRTAAAI